MGRKKNLKSQLRLSSLKNRKKKIQRTKQNLMDLWDPHQVYKHKPNSDPREEVKKGAGRIFKRNNH